VLQFEVFPKKINEMGFSPRFSFGHATCKFVRQP